MIIKVSHKDLSCLSPSTGWQSTPRGTFAENVETFLKQRGVAIPELSAKDHSRIKDMALYYWLNHKHDNLTETAWLYGYCCILKIDLDLSK